MNCKHCGEEIWEVTYDEYLHLETKNDECNGFDLEVRLAEPEEEVN